MRTEIKFTNEEAKRIKWLLCERYKKKSNTNLSTLIKMAARREAAEEGKKYLNDEKT